MIEPIAASVPRTRPDRPTSEDPLWRAAQALEQNFLAEMLKSAGLGAMEGAFSGGVGEDQFTSYLRDAQAKEMVSAGGIGLAERLFHAMKETSNER